MLNAVFSMLDAGVAVAAAEAVDQKNLANVVGTLCIYVMQSNWSMYPLLVAAHPNSIGSAPPLLSDLVVMNKCITAKDMQR